LRLTPVRDSKLDRLIAELRPRKSVAVASIPNAIASLVLNLQLPDKTTPNLQALVDALPIAGEQVTAALRETIDERFLKATAWIQLNEDADITLGGELHTADFEIPASRLAEQFSGFVNPSGLAQWNWNIESFGQATAGQTAAKWSDGHLRFYTKAGDESQDVVLPQEEFWSANTEPAASLISGKINLKGIGDLESDSSLGQFYTLIEKAYHNYEYAELYRRFQSKRFLPSVAERSFKTVVNQLPPGGDYSASFDVKVQNGTLVISAQCTNDLFCLLQARRIVTNRATLAKRHSP